MGKIQITTKASLINFTTKIMIGSDMGEPLAAGWEASATRSNDTIPLVINHV